MFIKKLCVMVVTVFCFLGMPFVLNAVVSDCESWPESKPPLPGGVGLASNVQAFPGDGQVILLWDGPVGADGYYVFYTDCTAPEAKTVYEMDYKLVTVNYAEITGLTNSLTYQFRVLP